MKGKEFVTMQKPPNHKLFDMNNKEILIVLQGHMANQAQSKATPSAPVFNITLGNVFVNILWPPVTAPALLRQYHQLFYMWKSLLSSSTSLLTSCTWDGYHCFLPAVWSHSSDLAEVERWLLWESVDSRACSYWWFEANGLSHGWDCWTAGCCWEMVSWPHYELVSGSLLSCLLPW